MAWIYLLAAAVLEVIWPFTMKQSEGFTKLGPSIVTIICMVASGVLLSFAMRDLPLGTTYAIWTGIGIIGAFIAGIVWLGEGSSDSRLIGASMIILGIFVIKFADGA